MDDDDNDRYEKIKKEKEECMKKISEIQDEMRAIESKRIWPSTEDVSEAVTGHPKHIERLKQERAAAKEVERIAKEEMEKSSAKEKQKTLNAEQPSATYKTRTVTPEEK